MGVLSHMPLVVLLALLSVFSLPLSRKRCTHCLSLRGVKCHLPG